MLKLTRQSIFGPTDLVELSAIVAVSLVTVWVVPDWQIPHKTMLLTLHLNQVFLGCIAQTITNSRFALSVCVLFIDSAATLFQYAIWTGYVEGMGLDVYTNVNWKERVKFGILILLLAITASRAIESRVETMASKMVAGIESVVRDPPQHKYARMFDAQQSQIKPGY